MKSKLLFLIASSLFINLVSGQILYDENFDNLTVGNVSNDLTGTTPGQGGWYPYVGINIPPPLPDAAHFQIQNEAGRGKVLSLTGIPLGGGPGFVGLEKRGIEILWNSREVGNNVLKFECDFFTGNAPLTSFGSVIALYGKKHLLGGYGFWQVDGLMLGGIDRGTYSTIVSLNNNGKDLFINRNQWYHLIIYIDYEKANVHYEIPSLNVLKTFIVFDLLSFPDIMQNYPPSFISFYTKNGPLPDKYAPPTVKLDNVKITAIGKAPVSNIDILASKFNLYPNPVDDVVSITSKENIEIKEIIIYNTNGKIVKSQGYKYNNENEIQLNLQDISAGVYLILIKTNVGEIVKKLIKK